MAGEDGDVDSLSIREMDVAERGRVMGYRVVGQRQHPERTSVCVSLPTEIPLSRPAEEEWRRRPNQPPLPPPPRPLEPCRIFSRTLSWCSSAAISSEPWMAVLAVLNARSRSTVSGSGRSGTTRLAMRRCLQVSAVDAIIIGLGQSFRSH